MRKENQKLTIAQFAKLHEVNKRTLHYYDEISLFSPQSKSDRGYRYYDVSQSLDFEYIRMLKELNMSIEQIAKFRQNPTPADFLKIINEKEIEIDQQIQKLKDIQTIIQTKKEQILFCETLKDQEIAIERCKEEKLLVHPFDVNQQELSSLFAHLKEIWGIDQIRMGIGSYIALDQVLQKDFDHYQGVFSLALKNNTNLDSLIKPAGTYLCGYQKGKWDQIPCLYQRMLDYAKSHHLKLIGYCYEIGLNDFVISKEEDYITKIMIRIEEDE